jgi:hypothetical protein
MDIEVLDEFGGVPVIWSLGRVPCVGEELSGEKIVTRVVHQSSSRRGPHYVAKIYVKSK